MERCCCEREHPHRPTYAHDSLRRAASQIGGWWPAAKARPRLVHAHLGLVPQLVRRARLQRGKWVGESALEAKDVLEASEPSSGVMAAAAVRQVAPTIEDDVAQGGGEVAADCARAHCRRWRRRWRPRAPAAALTYFVLVARPTARCSACRSLSSPCSRRADVPAPTWARRRRMRRSLSISFRRR